MYVVSLSFLIPFVMLVLSFFSSLVLYVVRVFLYLFIS